MFGSRPTPQMVTPDAALPGRDGYPFDLPTAHRVLEASPTGPWPEGTEVLHVAMGCFWGAERIMWRLPGIVTTAAGYMGGYTANPTYEETCTGRTGHTETVLVAYDPAATSPEAILKAFWENHDPTTADRQGNDVGTQYRSAIYWTTPAQEAAAVRATRAAFQGELTRHGHGDDHHRVRLRGGLRSVLVCRGLPPAVPPQEPRRLLQPRPQWPDLSGRPGPPGRGAGADRRGPARLSRPGEGGRPGTPRGGVVVDRSPGRR
jgi:peptide-methionine (S)-S-oxide reductase